MKSKIAELSKENIKLIDEISECEGKIEVENHKLSQISRTEKKESYLYHYRLIKKHSRNIKAKTLQIKFNTDTMHELAETL